MSPKPDPLCSYCSKVILDPNHLLSCAHLGLISWCLGSFEQVKRSTCPLCKIVLLSLQRHHQATQKQASPFSPEELALSDTDEVQLHWLALGGPSQRGAFAVTQLRPRKFHLFYRGFQKTAIADYVSPERMGEYRVPPGGCEARVRHREASGLAQNV